MKDRMVPLNGQERKPILAVESHFATTFQNPGDLIVPEAVGKTAGRNMQHITVVSRAGTLPLNILNKIRRNPGIFGGIPGGFVDCLPSHHERREEGMALW